MLTRRAGPDERWATPSPSKSTTTPPRATTDQPGAPAGGGGASLKAHGGGGPDGNQERDAPARCMAPLEHSQRPGLDADLDARGVGGHPGAGEPARAVVPPPPAPANPARAELSVLPPPADRSRRQPFVGRLPDVHDQARGEQ